ncbi:glutamate--cysteine ligase [Melaminivora alkalimesophila]|uniref:Glutamate--cysteine ligase n=1 Tax=Melaminivora alkalimesophila TaxID=1165852 RepID=A0A317RGW2_9BURK|nr:glutamate--cysteine ligase [Melaminivora alkalimesophila]PWW48981.1 glutamate-cysteine ligase [Melaminivora alkalimesophila]
MSTLHQRLAALTDDRLAGMRRGIEKEGLRVLPTGQLALTPHPVALGSTLTHPSITTDYSESQLELITAAHPTVEQCLDELTELHQFVHRVLQQQQPHGELLWASSMPGLLPPDETIPLGRYGSSNIGRAKSIYRMGLGHRYGRRMQTISGIHYNWSLPGVGSDEYFALIRNFRRQAFVLLYLFGASPALCPCFVQGREHRLEPLGEGGRALYLPHATSLRMGRLGYQSEAQASLRVSYNGLEGYARSLHDALTRPYPPYEAIGLRNLGGDYNQLGTSLLQIENEFYGTIRPKRTVRPGERPLHALRDRGVEYVEVRLMDLDPFVPVGITASTMRLLDVFLLHCLLTDSPPDTPEEIAELKTNQHLTAERGREPGLALLRAGREVLLVDWAAQILAECEPIAAALDRAEGAGHHGQALQAARAALAQPELTPSAHVLAELRQQFDHDFTAFARAHSLSAREVLLAKPWTEAQQQRYIQLAAQSLAEQRRIEAEDSLPFEEWRERYMAVGELL